MISTCILLAFHLTAVLPSSEAPTPPTIPDPAAQVPGQTDEHRSGDFAVMTFNLRYASNASPNSWRVRRPVVLEQIRRESPDLIGTQEGLWRQIRDLELGLTDYDWIGLGRKGGSHGEFCALFFRRERFEPLEFDHFWLSDTPDRIASRSWGNQVVRMATWVRLRDRESGKELVVFNTHFDHEVQVSREKSAQLVLERAREHFDRTPVLLIGDFNAVAGKNRVHELLVGEGHFRDAWSEAKERGPDVSTFHGYRGPSEEGRRIDWILLRGGWSVLSSRVPTLEVDGQYPSDHFPVVARLRWGDGG